MKLFNFLFWPLLLTIVLEICVLAFLKENKKRVYGLCLLMNCCTNLSANLASYFLNFTEPVFFILFLILAEALIWSLEALGYFFVKKEKGLAIKYSVLCNGISFSIGCFIQAILAILEVKGMFLDVIAEPENLNAYVSIGITLGIIVLILIFCGIYFLVKYFKNKEKK